MIRYYKIVFKDGDVDKCIFGGADLDNENILVKVMADEGNVLYINKAHIIFMKEIKERKHDY